MIKNNGYSPSGETLQRSFGKQKISTEASQILKGLVVSVNTYSFTADVFVSTKQILQDCPILNVMGGPRNRDITWLNDIVQSEVLLLNVGGIYYVSGTIPVQASQSVGASTTFNNTNGEEDTNDKNAVSRNFKNGRASDFVSGDKLISTKDGVLLGLFKGGIARLKASPLAQIVLCRFKDLVRIVSRNFQLYTDFGIIEIQQKSTGEVSASIMGGGNYESETSPQVQKYTVSITAGSIEGDSGARFYIKVNDANNGQHCIFRMGKDGKFKLEATDDIALEAVRNTSLTALENMHIGAVLNKTEMVGVNSTETVLGLKTVTTGGPQTYNSTSAVKITAPVIFLN